MNKILGLIFFKKRLDFIAESFEDTFFVIKQIQ